MTAGLLLRGVHTPGYTAHSTQETASKEKKKKQKDRRRRRSEGEQCKDETNHEIPHRLKEEETENNKKRAHDKSPLRPK